MLFNQDYGSCYDELINWYPRYYREVREMRALLKAHGQLADDMQADIEQVLDNAFVTTADEMTIAAMETILNIPYSQISGKTLEERRSLVLTYFVGNGRISASMIEQMIKTYTDAEVDIRFEDYDSEGNQALYVYLYRDGAEFVMPDEIKALLAARLPAHIQYVFAEGTADTTVDESELETFSHCIRINFTISPGEAELLDGSQLLDGSGVLNTTNSYEGIYIEDAS